MLIQIRLTNITIKCLQVIVLKEINLRYKILIIY